MYSPPSGEYETGELESGGHYSCGDESLRFAFLNSWRTGAAKGSGTAVAISGLALGLESLGHRVDVLPPRAVSPSLTLNRLVYNAGLMIRPPGDAYDAVVGFDIDGFLLPEASLGNYGVCLFGISAEERRFEKGWPRVYLSALSHLEKINARRARRTIVPSGHSRRIAIEAYGLKPEKVSVVPLGIDLKLWDSLAAAPPRREDTRPVILSVARQYPRKNTRLLIAAMPEVRRAAPEVLLRVIGGGPMLPALKQQAGELGLGAVVEFWGELASDEIVRRAFFQADVFALPSLQEGFGLVFLESMAAGLPIVAARAAAVPEVAPDGEAAILVSGKDAGELAAVLIALLKDDQLREKLRAGGRARVRRHGWAEVALLFAQAFG